MDYGVASPLPPPKVSQLFQNVLNNPQKVLLFSADSRGSLENQHNTDPKLLDT